MKRLSAAILAIAAFIAATAQTTREEVYADLNKAGGVYYAYPVTESSNTPAPKGYKPFYISHYGRHGSRYLISDKDYRRVIKTLDGANRAGALTPLCENVLARLERIWPEAEGRGGDLTPLGARQHNAIATRMYRAFPEVFTPESEITAQSTTVLRCALSMAAFCEGLKEQNPQLRISRESSDRYMHYLNYHSPESNRFTAPDGPWREEYRKFEESHTRPDRLVSSLVKDPEYIRRHINPGELMWGLYWIAVDMQNMESPERFYDIFEKDELFDLWQCVNYRFYVCDSNYKLNNGMMLDNAKPQLRNIVETADSYISGDKRGASLRFGHDGNLIPLAGVMGLKDCYNSVENPDDFYKAFSDFKLAPMAGNIQMVFFRNKAGHVIVKFMHNERETSIPIETDIYPFYHWGDVRAYYLGLLGEE